MSQRRFTAPLAALALAPLVFAAPLLAPLIFAALFVRAAFARRAGAAAKPS